MSTRSVIARPEGDRFVGRYHHFDGYPSGLGAELWSLAHGTAFAPVDGESQIERMRQVLIEQHPAGWSSIQNADWSQEPGFSESHDMNRLCITCGKESWRHYEQYYKDHPGEPIPPRVKGYQVFDHAPEMEQFPSDFRPHCYCHGDREEEVRDYIRSDGDDWGTEWAYVLADKALVVYERRWNDGTPMVGMFGLGADEGKGYWQLVGSFPWNGPEPGWNALQGE